MLSTSGICLTALDRTFAHPVAEKHQRVARLWGSCAENLASHLTTATFGSSGSEAGFINGSGDGRGDLNAKWANESPGLRIGQSDDCVVRRTDQEEGFLASKLQLLISFFTRTRARTKKGSAGIWRASQPASKQARKSVIWHQLLYCTSCQSVDNFSSPNLLLLSDSPYQPLEPSAAQREYR